MGIGAAAASATLREIISIALDTKASTTGHSLAVGTAKECFE